MTRLAGPAGVLVATGVAAAVAAQPPDACGPATREPQDTAIVVATTLRSATVGRRAAGPAIALRGDDPIPWRLCAGVWVRWAAARLEVVNATGLVRLRAHPGAGPARRSRPTPNPSSAPTHP